ncbi:MAG: hypothetical protein KGZ58_09825, partial [Ignavibacteriales bacterium]|nr:hypothetical protein [Ignavibacteriales bacterium]
MMDDPSKEVSRISGESIVTSDVGQDAVLISVDKVSNDSSFKNQKNTVYDVFDFSDQSTLPFFEIQKNVIDFQEKLVSATTEFPLLNKISPTHISIMSKSLFYKLFDYFSEQWVNEQAMKKFVNVRFVTKGIKQKKFISFLRRIIPNVL